MPLVNRALTSTVWVLASAWGEMKVMLPVLRTSSLPSRRISTGNPRVNSDRCPRGIFKSNSRLAFS
jgi:hypothetical protein